MKTQFPMLPQLHTTFIAEPSTLDEAPFEPEPTARHSLANSPDTQRRPVSISNGSTLGPGVGRDPSSAPERLQNGSRPAPGSISNGSILGLGSRPGPIQRRRDVAEWDPGLRRDLSPTVQP